MTMMRAPPPRPEFALPPTAEIERALRTVLVRHARYAIALLRHDALDVHVAIHESRRALRRLRAALQLLQPHQRERYDEWIVPLREAGRVLSPLRDRQSVQEAVDALERAKRGGLDPDTAQAIRRRLGSAGRREEPGMAAAIARAIELLASSIVHLRLAAQGVALDDLLAGLAVSLRRARRAMRAATDDADELAMHRWRRRLRALWLQWELLTPMWPRGMAGLVADSKRASQQLGLARDLDLLARRMSRWQAALGEVSVATVRERMAARRSVLIARARRASALLLAESPAAQVRRMRRYWKLGVQALPQSNGASPT